MKKGNMRFDGPGGEEGAETTVAPPPVETGTTCDAPAEGDE